MDVKEYGGRSVKHEIQADMSANINPSGVSPKAIERLNNLSSRHINHYYMPNSQLIGKIAEYVGLEPENIMLGDGCDGCLSMIAQTFLSKGDQVMIPVPTFHRYEFHSRLMGADCIHIPLGELNHEHVSASNAKILFLCNPNNPTGTTIDKDMVEGYVRRFKGLVVIDEALADGLQDCIDLVRKYDNLVIARTFSKVLGMAGLRIGYLAGSRGLIDVIKKVSSPFKVNGIAQEMAEAALEDKDFIRKSVEFIDEERERMLKTLREIGVRCSNSSSMNFLMSTAKISSDPDNALQILERKGVKVSPGGAFRIRDPHQVRIAVSTKRQNDHFLKTMKGLVEDA